MAVDIKAKEDLTLCKGLPMLLRLFCRRGLAPMLLLGMVFVLGFDLIATSAQQATSTPRPSTATAVQPTATRSQPTVTPPPPRICETPSASLSFERFMQNGDVSFLIHNRHPTAAAYLTGFSIDWLIPKFISAGMLKLRRVTFGGEGPDDIYSDTNPTGRGVIVWQSTRATTGGTLITPTISNNTSAEWLQTVVLPARTTAKVYFDFHGIGPFSLGDFGVEWEDFGGMSLTLSCDPFGNGSVQVISNAPDPVPSGPSSTPTVVTPSATPITPTAIVPTEPVSTLPATVVIPSLTAIPPTDVISTPTLEPIQPSPTPITPTEMVSTETPTLPPATVTP